MQIRRGLSTSRTYVNYYKILGKFQIPHEIWICIHDPRLKRLLGHQRYVMIKNPCMAKMSNTCFPSSQSTNMRRAFFAQKLGEKAPFKRIRHEYVRTVVYQN